MLNKRSTPKDFYNLHHSRRIAGDIPRVPRLLSLIVKMAKEDSPAGVIASKESKEALYSRYLHFCNTHNFEAMESFYTSPLNVNDEPWAPDKVTAQFKPLVAAFPDWHWELRNLSIDGDYLALHFRVGGTHKGTFQGIEPTGRRVTTTQFTLYRLNGDGLFMEVWDLLDINGLVAQIR